MKILVISLLRLGDLIQQGALLKGLRAQYPAAEIHVLMNRQFADSGLIMRDLIDHCIFFDRDAIQKGLGEANYNVLWSYSQVEKLIRQLNGNRYTKVFNFTHNRLSAYLMGALMVTEKHGLYFSGGRFHGLTQPWLRFLNDRFSGRQPSLFHYLEILGKAFQIPVERYSSRSDLNRKSKTILFQCLTSDKKKNWGLEKYQELKRVIELSLVDYRVAILGAPFEENILLQAFSQGDLLICDLAEAQHHLQSAALLVSGDTSIKHLAAQVGTPIVEIALGSSDPSKTAAFSDRVLVLSASVPCSPCIHSSPCPHEKHLCATEVSVERVFESVWKQLSREAGRVDDPLQSLERAVWGLFLDQVPLSGDCINLRSEQEVKIFSERKDWLDILRSWRDQGSLYRSWWTRAQQASSSDLISLAHEILKSPQYPMGYFQSLLEAMSGQLTRPQEMIDRARAALIEINELLLVREEFTRCLQTHSMKGDFYAKGIGRLPVSGFAKAGESVSASFKDSGLQSRSRKDATP